MKKAMVLPVINLLLVLALLISKLCSAGMLEESRREGWTFQFNEKHPKYATGLIHTESYGQPHRSFDDVEIPIPDEYDPRDKLTPIRDQKQCGSCWAFSEVTSLADAFAIKGRVLPLLSVQSMVDCALDQWGCNGGTLEAAKWLVTPDGSPSEQSYPYVARNQHCKGNPAIASAKSWAYVGAEGRVPSVKEIQKAILLHSSVSSIVGADNYLASYKSGIYNKCTRTQPNHMTNVVGWSASGKYWIMRNSWGEGWGEKGWGRISWPKNGRLCNNLAQQAIFFEVKP